MEKKEKERKKPKMVVDMGISKTLFLKRSEACTEIHF